MKSPNKEIEAQEQTWQQEFDSKVALLDEDGEQSSFGYKVQEHDAIWTVTDWGHIKGFITKVVEKEIAQAHQAGNQEGWREYGQELEDRGMMQL